MILETPILRAYVRKEFLRNLEDGHGEFIECYIESLVNLKGRPLLFNIHTKDGAKVARLPPHALCLKPNSPARELSELQLWACLSNKAQVIQKSYFKGYEVKCKIGNKVEIGEFLFEVEQFTENLSGFEDHPDQHKTFNVIALEDGNIAALPNNRCLFLDNHFTKSVGVPSYKTNTHYWKTEQVDFSVGDSDEMFYEAKGESET